ncbi:ASCH domain-containing protein [Pseudomonas sp.]|uniref:ASCH domain-containing protein n=1 Tax=Pseudomonas sp. TaxID=306 RepID=UPI0031E3E589
MQAIVLSIKPKYCDLIYEGLKTVELRRKIGSAFTIGCKIYIYSSSPVKALTGEAKITKIDLMKIADLKIKHMLSATINEEDFDSYFHGCTQGYAISISQVTKYDKPISLLKLKTYKFSPPQSFSYQCTAVLQALGDN